MNRKVVKVPDGFICVTPVDDMGQMVIRATCVHLVILAPTPEIIISPDGSKADDYVVVVGGVMGGRKFSFKVEEDIEEVVTQLDNASAYYTIERLNSADATLLDFRPDPEERAN